MAPLLPRTLDLLEQMVRINSFTANAAGVARLGALTAAAFAPMGFHAETVPSVNPEFGPHLFLKRPGAGRRLVLVTHLDTVFPEEEEAANDFHWRPAPDEGRIYGPGTVDIKGGTALLWMMLEGLRSAAPGLFADTEWIVAANASEEVLASDFAAETVRQTGGKADAVLVFEGGMRRLRTRPEFTLVTGRKGRANYRISVSGRGAHAGSQHADGINAIVELAGIVPRLAALTDYGRELSLNVGTIRGGTVVNRVPHEAVLELEMRAFDPDILRAAMEAVEAEACRAPLLAGCRTQVELEGTTAAWPGSPETGRLFEAFRQAGEELGCEVLSERRGGLSDANYLSGLGPVLDGLGPSGGNAHCSERSADGFRVPEFVEPGSMVPKAVLNALAIIRGVLTDP